MPSKKFYFFNQTRSKLIADNVLIADSFFKRLKGLLGTDSLMKGTGIYIVPCAQIHMFGMKYAIDAVFVDKNNEVVGLVENIKPGQLSRSFRKARGCLEVPSGTILDTGVSVGDLLVTGEGPYCGPS